ncbi:phosphatidylserine decarboxylase [Endozoicomonas arenosclerae]|uniref:phosphatidylserine decarboxylase n=1 Tax=Endozoicomonas arenosclerae TaxID=1633495 RepID=UPI00078466FE|nr:phosphatidylserine decarboxylase [Endozoicomonas arenosclerae]
MNALKDLPAKFFLIFFLLTPTPSFSDDTSPKTVTPSPLISYQVEQLKQYLTQQPNIQKALIEGLTQHCQNGALPAVSTLEDLYKMLVALPVNVIRRTEVPFDQMSCTFEKMAEVKASPFEPPVLFPWMISYFRSFHAYMEQPESIAYINHWLDSPAVGIQDFIVPVGGYTSFNDFFGRRLKPGVRPITSLNDDAVVVSPNDGSIKIMHKEISKSTAIKAKGDMLNISRVFGNHPLARHFIGGTVLESTLHEYSYHHFHSPISGTVMQAALFPETTFSDTGHTDPWSTTAYNHHRGAYIIHNDKLGYVGVIPVGIWFISDITLLAESGSHVAKGQELGHFAFGGSTILLFFEPGAIKTHLMNQESSVRMGETIAQTH